MDPLIITAVLETMKAVKELTRERGGDVSLEFLTAQQQLVNKAADLADDLDAPDGEN